MFIFGIQFGIHIEVFYMLIQSFWVCVVRHAQSAKNKKFICFQCLQKNIEDEHDFLSAEKHESFLHLIVSLWVCVARHVPSTQSKSAISLQYPKESMKDENDFLTADKHQNFLQNDTIILGVYADMLKSLKITNWLFLCNTLRKK